MSPEVLLVQEIEKYEYLYNTYLPEYNRKDLTDEAWCQVSRATNLTVTECKEKWRNIRSSFLRSLKPSERAKKPYYLKSYLNFVLPFLKPISQGVDYKDDLYNTANIGTSHKDDILMCTVKSEEEALICDVLNNEVTNEESQDPLSQPVSPAPHKRKRSETTSNHKRRNNQIEPNEEQSSATYDTPQTNIESMQYFLMSLLPEIESMTGEQTRMFKIKVMMLVDEIKTNFRMVKQTMPSSSESDRLQKRLINLLIKNLQKKF